MKLSAAVSDFGGQSDCRFGRSSFGGLRGLSSGRLGCLWFRLFMVVPMTPAIKLLPGVVDTGQK
jgi:hypothetical protein